MVSYQSNVKVWWLGQCGHEWQASTSHRYRGRGCPYCCNNAVLPGFNDLSTTNPNLAKEWDYSKFHFRGILLQIPLLRGVEARNCLSPPLQIFGG